MKTTVKIGLNRIERLKDYQDLYPTNKSCPSCNLKNHVQTTISENFKELAI
jgi:hypothetical protein